MKRWFCPTPGTDLTAVTAALPRLAPDIDVFQFYAYPLIDGMHVPFCGENTYEHLKAIGLVKALYELKIPIAVEAGVVKPGQAAALKARATSSQRPVVRNLRGFPEPSIPSGRQRAVSARGLTDDTRRLLDGARALGGRISHLTMDEPFLGGLGEGQSVSQVAERCKSYIEVVKAHDPEVQIGMVEAWPALSADVLLQAMRALSANDVTLTHLTLDTDHNHVRQDRIDMTTVMRRFRDELRSLNVPFGVCVWGHNDQTNGTWCADALRLLSGYQTAFGNDWPDILVTQSWSAGWQDQVPTPRSIPTTTPETGDTLWAVQREVNRRLLGTVVPPPEPVPQPGQLTAFAVVAKDAKTGGPVGDAHVVLGQDGRTKPDGYQIWAVQLGVPFQCKVEHPGYETFTAEIMPTVNLQRDVLLVPKQAPQPQPPIPPPVALSPLRRDGMRIIRLDGSRFDYRGLTGFKLLAVGEQQQDDFFGFAQRLGVTEMTSRVLLSCQNMFSLNIEDGLGRLPALCDKAAKYGQRIEACVLADTSLWTGIMGYTAYLNRARAIIKSNLKVEGANEPKQPWQANVAEIVKQPGGRETLYAPGAVDGANDESPEFNQGDYRTFHSDRNAGEDGWRKVRHAKEGYHDIKYATKLYPVDNEPWRADTDLDPAKHYARACLTWICAGATGGGHLWHSETGKHALVPTAAERPSLEATVKGWQERPADFFGDFKNAGWTDSPIRTFSGANRCYSAVQGNVAYTVALDATNVQIAFQNGFHVVDEHQPFGPKARLFRLER